MSAIRNRLTVWMLVAAAWAFMTASVVAAALPAEDVATLIGHVELIDQDGKSAKLYDDIAKDRTIVVAAFHLECSTTTPTLLTNLKKLQDALGSKLDREVRVVAITVEPDKDTPERLKQKASALGFIKGSRLMTGKPGAVHNALRRFGLDVAVPENHPPFLFVGNAKTGVVKRVVGLGKAEDIQRIVEQVAVGN